MPVRIKFRKVVRELDLGDYGLEIKEPASFWDRFKDRWFPERLLDRFPPRFKVKANSLTVWVNPPRRLRMQLALFGHRASQETNRDALARMAEEFYGVMSEVWSQGAQTYTTEDVRQLATAAAEHDPEMWQLMVSKTAEMIAGYDVSAQKN